MPATSGVLRRRVFGRINTPVFTVRRNLIDHVVK
jgi:hypothetical protein